MNAAKDLFGVGEDDGGLNLNTFLPKSLKDFEDYAQTLAAKYVLGHKDSKNYKVRVCVGGGICEDMRVKKNLVLPPFLFPHYPPCLRVYITPCPVRALYRCLSRSSSSRPALCCPSCTNMQVLIKALIKQACQPLSAADSKEVESFIGNVRVEKTKEEAAAAAAKAKSGECQRAAVQLAELYNSRSCTATWAVMSAVPQLHINTELYIQPEYWGSAFICSSISGTPTSQPFTSAPLPVLVSTVPRKQLNTGGGKGKSAGLDDFIYEDAGDGDDDFM